MERIKLIKRPRPVLGYPYDSLAREPQGEVRFPKTLAAARERARGHLESIEAIREACPIKGPYFKRRLRELQAAFEEAGYSYSLEQLSRIATPGTILTLADFEEQWEEEW